MTVSADASTTLPRDRIGLGVRHDAGDAIAVDDDVDVRLRRRARHVDQRARVHDRAAGGHGRRPREIERHVLRLAGLDVDDAQLVERLIEDVPRVARPARRVRALRRDAARRPERLAGARDRPDGQHALVDRRHLRAVGRPHRAAAAARVDRQQSARARTTCRLSSPPLRRRSSAPGSCLRGSAARAARPAPARCACRRATTSACRAAASVSWIVVTVPAGDVDHRHLRHAPHAVDVEEGDPRAVGRPRRALRLRRQRGDLAARARPPCRGSRAAGASLSLSDEYDELRAVGRPRRIGVERRVVREVHRRCRRPASRRCRRRRRRRSACRRARSRAGRCRAPGAAWWM